VCLHVHLRRTVRSIVRDGWGNGSRPHVVEVPLNRMGDLLTRQRNLASVNT